MKLDESSLKVIKETIANAVSPFRTVTDTPVVTDIHIYASRESGELTVSDDDHALAWAVIPELNELPEESFVADVEEILVSALHSIDQSAPLESLGIWKPFSFVLADEDGEAVSELMVFDDDNTPVSQTLMDGLDQELDDFLRRLLG